MKTLMKTYKSNAGKHRNKIPKADRTIWLVSEEVETAFFWDAVENDYICDRNCYWWVNVNSDNQIKTIMGQTDVDYAYIAKFTSDHGDEWHGYPVTAKRSPHDVPHTKILERWRKLNFFTKKEVTDLKRGRGYVKSCA